MNKPQLLQNGASAMKNDELASIKEPADQHMDIHGQIVQLIEMLSDDITLVEDKGLRSKLERKAVLLGELRMDAEFVAMGPEWARRFMCENEWSELSIDQTTARLFGPA